MQFKNLFFVLVLASASVFSQFSSAEETTKDVFMKGKNAKGVSVEFDCNSKDAKSPYCLLQIVDSDHQVICYGLVSNEKVVNPSISCVPIKK